MFIETIYYRPKLETIQLSSNRWMVKQTMLHPHHEILLSNRTEQTTAIKNNLDEPQGIMLSKKANLKRICTEWIYYVTIVKYHNYKDGEQISICLGLGTGERERMCGCQVLAQVICDDLTGEYFVYTGSYARLHINKIALIYVYKRGHVWPMISK